MLVELYQIKDIENVPYVFRNWLDSTEHEFNFADYEKVYEYNYPEKADEEVDINEVLEKAYGKFNWYKPNDFTGHLLSVSDIIKVNNRYYYCSSVDWVDTTDKVEGKICQ